MSQKTAKFYGPQYAWERTLLDILRISAFVSFTLLFFFLWFQPDKVQSLESSKRLAVTGGLALTAFAVMSISLYLMYCTFPRNFRTIKRKLSQEIALVAVPLLMLGVGIFLYFYLLEFIRLNPIAFIKIQLRTLLIGLSPMIVSTRFLVKKSVPSNEGFKSGFNPVVSLYSNSGRDVVKVNYEDLLFIASADNYVFIYSKNSVGVRKELLRNSLNRVEEALKNYPGIFRCHRTAIVNLDNVKYATGNSQGYALQFNHIDKTVPVARSKVPSIRKLLPWDVIK